MKYWYFRSASFYLGYISGYILGLYCENGKENGHYYNGVIYRDYISVYIRVILG